MEVEVGKHKLPEEKYVEVLYKQISFLKRYPAFTAFAVLVVIIGAVSLFLFIQQQSDSNDKAWQALYELDSADKLDTTTASLVAGTSAEPLFLLEAGRMLFERLGRTTEDLTRAEKSYRQFCTDHKDHPGLEFAQQSLAYVLEEKQEYEEALQLFSALAKGDSHLAKESMWDAGRCAELTGKLDIAKDYYKRLKEDGARPWCFYAGTRLAELLSQESKREESQDG